MGICIEFLNILLKKVSAPEIPLHTVSPKCLKRHSKTVGSRDGWGLVCKKSKSMIKNPFEVQSAKSIIFKRDD